MRRRSCYAWNEGRCNYPYCRYRHACLRCRGDHRGNELFSTSTGWGTTGSPPCLGSRAGPDVVPRDRTRTVANSTFVACNGVMFGFI